MFSDPEQIVASLGLRNGEQVADLGAGAGRYVMAASKYVGEEGKVFAVEILEDMVKRLQSDLDQANIVNVLPVWGDIEHPGGTRLRDASMDVVFFVNVLFQVTDKSGALAEAKRILKPQGRLLVVDWTDSHGSMGPQPEQVFTEEAARSACAEAGFQVSQSIEAGSHHYGFVAGLVS